MNLHGRDIKIFTANSNPKLAKEMCEYLGVSRDTLLTWINEKGMPASKVGRSWKFKISEVDAWIKSGEAADR